MIASYVSYQNECHFCHTSHGASAAHHFGGDLWDISPKLRILLDIAKKVQKSGLEVNEEDIQKAKDEGANDQEIHDTVLIAAAFCMYNRYVDGLGTWAPEDNEAYDEMGKLMAHEGYTRDRPDLD